MRNLGHERDRYGPFLIPVIPPKFPKDLNLISCRTCDSADSCDIEITLNALKFEITTGEKT